MRNGQHILLAGIAALALVAASGVVSAQQTQQGGAAQSSMQSQGGQQGASNRGRSANQSANQGMRNQRAQQGRNQNAMSRQPSGQNAQNQSTMQSRQGNAGSSNRSAQTQNRNRGASAANRTAQGQQNQRNAQSKTQSKTGQFATQQGNKTQRGTSTAQRNEQLKGLQGSTRAPMQGATSTEQRGGGAANVSLNDQQRTQIRDSVINSRSAPRVSNVDFSVNVGTVVPRGRIHMVRVPPTLIRIEPRWRRFMYFVYNNEIVIVDPRTMRIVNVLPV